MYFQKSEVKGKTALVTGAGKGIGKASAIALAEAGADLIILSRTKSDLEKVKKEIIKLKRKCVIYDCDVSNFEELRSVFNQISKLDIIVNNAGTNRPEHFTKINKEDMDYVVDLNLKAAFHVAQMGAKVLTKQKNRKSIGGSIINVSSQLGKVGAPKRSIYNMTKFGIEGLTRGMALDLAKNDIRSRVRKRESTLLDHDDFVQEGLSPEERLEKKAQKKRLYACISNLPAKQKEVVKLRLIGQLTFIEISEVLNIKESNAKVHFSQAKQKLVSLLKHKVTP